MADSKVVRLTRAQLRGLIREVDSDNMPETDLEAQADELVHVWTMAHSHAYDEGDPSMAALGKREWESQVSQAAEHLRAEILALLERETDSLMGGEYHRG